MNKLIPNLLLTCIISGSAFLIPEKVFSQTSPGEIKPEEINSLTTEKSYTYVKGILPVGLISGYAFLVPEKVFSKSGKGEIKTEKNDTITTIDKGSYTHVKGITTGRAISLVGGAMGLLSLIIGWRAKVRSTQKEAKIAITFGLLAILLALVHLGTVAGAVFGSGSGKAGSLVTLPLAIIGATLGILTLRSLNSN